MIEVRIELRERRHAQRPKGCRGFQRLTGKEHANIISANFTFLAPELENDLAPHPWPKRVRRLQQAQNR